MKILYGGTFITPEGRVEDKALLFDTCFMEFVDIEKIGPMEAEKIYFSGTALPGFIDIHIHGACGRDVMEGSPEALETIATALLQRGITSWLPTTLSAPREELEKALQCIRHSIDRISGARILGAYLEGPFLSPEYAGAHPREYLTEPDLWVKDYLDIIKIVTIAPERDKNFSFIKQMREHVCLSIGHSSADYATALAAYDEGVRHITHCFNAMPGLHHRNPGIIGAMMNRDFTTEFIGDGIHIHPDLLEPLMHLKKSESLILVSDAMAGTFLEDGEYTLGGSLVNVKEGRCSLADGTLAGSIHSLDRTLKTMLEVTHFPLEEISKMLSENPAKRLGVDHITGSIRSGLSADLVILDEDGDVERVFFKGEAIEKCNRA